MAANELDARRAEGLVDRVGLERDPALVSRLQNVAGRWRERMAAARKTMDERSSRPGVLIEVAAQHPLVDGASPGEEFSARLLRGRDLYREAVAGGRPATVYVPGSRHVFDGVEDAVSLSEAGGEYLRRLGVPPEDVRGDDLNKAYLGDDGVYGSVDECFVTASHFLDGEFGRLYCVVSPFQLPRKLLHYIEFGVLPLVVTAPTPEAFHDLLDELFLGVPEVLFETDATRTRQKLLVRHHDRRPGRARQTDQ
jgi:hypothetical protein